MDMIAAIFLAVVQGFTEFLPISSSAHLVMVPILFGWPDQGIAFDIAVHFGTLAAVLWYFRKTLCTVVTERDTTLVGQLAIGTLPIVLVGIVLHDWIAIHLRNLEVIAFATIGFGLLLWIADRSNNIGAAKEVTWKLALIIGLAQTLALIPGTSRSGITITVALMLGLSRTKASEFSFLLAIPTIMIAFAYEFLKGIGNGFGEIHLLPTAVAMLVSAITAYLTLTWLFNWIKSQPFTVFVIYRLLLGGALLIFYT